MNRKRSPKESARATKATKVKKTPNKKAARTSSAYPSQRSRHAMAVFTGGSALLILVHNYLDTTEGLIGLSVEFFSLYTFGELGFMLLPLFLFAYAASLVAVKAKEGHYFLSFLGAFISTQQFMFILGDSYHSQGLRYLGHIGLRISSISSTLFGDLGALVLFAGLAIVSFSSLFNIPSFYIFKPFSFLYKIPLAFYKIVRFEFKKAAPIKRLVIKAVYALFFRRKEEVYEEEGPKAEPDIFDVLTQPISDRPVLDNPAFNTLKAGKEPQKTIAEPEVEDDIFTLDEPEEEVLDDSVQVEELDVELIEPPKAEDEPKVEEPNFTEADIPTVGGSVTVSENDDFELPPIHLLKMPAQKSKSNTALTRQRAEKAAILEETLASFNVRAKVVNITPGPTVTRYELQPGDGVKIAKITSLAKDIALKLAAPDVRIEAPIPGKSLVGIEVPNTDVEMITLRAIMENSNFATQPSYLTAVLGKTISGESIVIDIGKMPHMLIAGATGSGKSVCINAIILSILMKARPDEVKLLMIDPKKVELSLYEGIPHLLAPVVTNPNKAAATLKRWALVEMEKRYEMFSAVGVKDIKGFNNYVQKELKKNPEATIPDTELPLQKVPYVVVIIDELADLMMVAAQDVESTICRLAQMARATGIHLVIATQRPSVNVITGLIKANVPSRISFYLQSQIDSRTILDMPGAEKLLGKGDMLYSPVGSFNPTRIQGVFVSESEVHAVVSWLKKQGQPDYVNEIIDVEPIEDSKDKSKSSDKDELYDDAKELIINSKYASTSYLQRKLRIGYNRAARIMDELEADGVIAEYVGDRKSRSVP